MESLVAVEAEPSKEPSQMEPSETSVSPGMRQTDPETESSEMESLVAGEAVPFEEPSKDPSKEPSKEPSRVEPSKATVPQRMEPIEPDSPGVS